MRTFMTTTIAVLLTAPAAADKPRYLLADKAKAAFRPVEVAKSKHFIIHAIPRNTDRGWMPGWIMQGQDYILTHTSLPDGKLKVLLRSGVYRVYHMPKGVDTIGYQKTKLLGVAVKHKRVAVLTRVSTGGVVRMPKASKTPDYGKPRYRLTLFDARDGEKLSELPLDAIEIPEVASLWTIGPGPLKLERNRIKLWKRTIRIDQQGRMIVGGEGGGVTGCGAALPARWSGRGKTAERPVMPRALTAARRTVRNPPAYRCQHTPPAPPPRGSSRRLPGRGVAPVFRTAPAATAAVASASTGTPADTHTIPGAATMPLASSRVRRKTSQSLCRAQTAPPPG